MRRETDSSLRLLVGGVLATLGASAGLTHTFTAMQWLPPVALAVVVAFGAGWLGRRLGVPGAVGFIGSVLVLFVFVAVVFFPGTTLLGIPMPETFRELGRALDAAGAQIREEVAPVEVSRPLTMLACAGAYFIASIVDVMVFRWRRPAAAGLPLLALFLVPSSLAKEGGSAYPFIFAASGYLVLLIVEGRDRTRRWGRRLVGVGSSQELVNYAPISRTGARLGAFAVGLAIFVPLFVPDPGNGVLGGGGAGFGNGPSSVSVVNPIVNLRPQLRAPNDTELLRVTSSGRPPYLRLTSLDAFDGSNWTQSALNAPAKQRVAKKTLPDPPGLDGSAVDDVSIGVEVRNLDVRWLPAPYAPVKVRAKGDWRYDDDSRTVFSARAKTQKLSYEVESKVAHPSQDFLLGSDPTTVQGSLARYTLLPPSRSQLADNLLAELVEGQDTAYEVVLSIQDYLRGPDFEYSLNVPAGTSQSALDRFLTIKQGYCEQFAATMAYLVRLAGIPARVAIGFTPGTQVAAGVWSITNKDAHAWPEVFFPGAGWLSFEPTPRPDGLPTPDYAPLGADAPSTGGSAEPTTAPSPTASPTTTDAPSQPQEREPEDPLSGATNADGGTPVGRILGITALVLLGLAVVPSAARMLVHRRRRSRATNPAERAHAAWRNLADDAEDLGFPLRRSDSPRMAARRLRQAANLGNDGAAAIGRLAMAEERARYAPTAPDVTALDKAQRSARHALMHTRGRRRRMRARLFPPSVLRRAKATFRRRTSDALDWSVEVRRSMRRKLARS